MKSTHCLILVASLALASAMLAGCSGGVVYKNDNPDVVIVESNDKPGPPSHAPAHGYRKKHGSDVVLVYDRGIDVYVVNGHPDCWYSAGQFFRISGGTWEWSVDMSGPWKTVSSHSDLPPGLQKQKAKTGKAHGKKDKDDKKGSNK